MDKCPHHDDISNDIKETKEIVLKIYKRMFEDNGVESFQTFRVKTNNWINVHDKDREHKVSFWYWAIPIGVSILVVVIDKVFK